MSTPPRRRPTGSGAYGDVHAAPVDVACWLDPKRRPVRNKDEWEVQSSSYLSCDAAENAKFTPDSKATAYVIGVNALISGALDLPDQPEAHERNHAGRRGAA